MGRQTDKNIPFHVPGIILSISLMSHACITSSTQTCSKVGVNLAKQQQRFKIARFKKEDHYFWIVLSFFPTFSQLNFAQILVLHGV